MFVVFAVVMLLWLLNFLSYRVLNAHLSRHREWGLNICCGKTAYGTVNADIATHREGIANFILIDDIARLPFEDGQFKTCLCAHTIEHVPDPEAFDRELRRVSQEVTYILPPLWDIAAQLNFLEHRWIVLSWRKQHHQLPPLVRNPLALLYGYFFKQKVRA